jgi:putative OPT family oligopeptide transporter
MPNPSHNTPEAAPQAAAYQPYIPASATLREFTPRALILGALLGMVFGASSLYLVLKVGMTVSASIPVAVISLTLFRMWSRLGGRDATTLENNIVQTAGSAGESIAFGLGVTMPAILILGFDLEIARVMLVALLGGLLGILMMIPLRRALIVQQHGVLKYPEGTACAQVLMAAADPESRAAADAALPNAPREQTGTAATAGASGFSARAIFVGFGLGLAYKILMSAFKLWKDIPQKVFGAPFKSASVAAEISPELLGVGYIVGLRISAIMVAGGAFSYLLLIPLIKFFGEGLSTALPPGATPIAEMSPGAIRGAYILYIGAGAVAMGGLISMARSLPTIWHGLRAGIADFKRAAATGVSIARTDRDLPMKFVAGGILLLPLLIMSVPSLHMNLVGALLIVLFGFLFVTVSSRLTGEIGSSSNPVSGMTVATLLLTCLIFLLVGWTGGTHYVTALSVGGIVCIAASNGGTTSQDLKTGFLVGATPKYQQIAILIGAAASALLLGPVLVGLNQTGTVYVPASQVAPGLRVSDGFSAAPVERLQGRQAAADSGTYRVWHKVDTSSGPAGKYLINESGAAVWFVDPGINGSYTQLPDGTEARKFDAPKATLMSYIIKGILDRELPWSLVLFGVMIAVVMELCGVSSLVFAVGVYLPISSSAPIFIGGLVRWLVDRRLRRRQAARQMDEAQLAAESDRSPGVLLASGYIAGGAIAGIVIAFLAGVLGDLDAAITRWAAERNPFFAGAHANWLALLPFAALVVWLYWTGRKHGPDCR